MWKPTAGIVQSVYYVKGSFFSPSYGILICTSHTGKVFLVDIPYGEAKGTNVGQAIFCNGDFCRRMDSYELALKRLEEVIKQQK